MKHRNKSKKFTIPLKSPYSEWLESPILGYNIWVNSIKNTFICLSLFWAVCALKDLRTLFSIRCMKPQSHVHILREYIIEVSVSRTVIYSPRKTLLQCLLKPLQLLLTHTDKCLPIHISLAGEPFKMTAMLLPGWSYYRNVLWIQNYYSF